MLLVAIVWGVLGAPPAAATSTPAETIEVVGRRLRPAPWQEDRTASAAVIDLDERISLDYSLGDALRGTAGLRVLRSGARGAFEGVSIRGSELDHTVVLVGDLPVTGTDRGAFDLSMLPLSAFERIEVFRGGAPAWFDQGQIGGLIRLTPRRAPVTGARAEAGAGSFGAYWGRAEGALRSESAGGLVAATASARANDYRYLDDGATRFDPSDDRIRRRSNEDLAEASGVGLADWRSGGHRIEALVIGLHRDAGVPGPGHRPAAVARRQRTRLIGAAAYSFVDQDDDWRIQAAVNGGWDRDAFDDPNAEIGLGGPPEDTDDRFMGVGGRIAAQVGLTDGLEATVVSQVRYDRYEPDNRFAVPGDEPSQRWILGATLEARAFGQLGPVHLEARPSASIRYSQARLVDISSDRRSTTEIAEEAPNLRLGLYVSPARWLSARGSVATGVRWPTILELFGDRGNLQANPELRRERAMTWDVGLIVEGEARVFGESVRARLEATFFGSEVNDLIRYRRTSQFTAVAENADSGRILGVEATLKVELPLLLSLDGQGTWLDARDQLARRLPLRPQWTGWLGLQGRSGTIVDGWLDDVRARLDVQYVGASFVDDANLVEIDERIVFGAALVTAHWQERIWVTFEMRDLFDAAGTDLLGFPLPGRRFDVAISWTGEFE